MNDIWEYNGEVGILVNGQLIAEIKEGEAENAEHLIKTANLFPELVEALEEIVDAEWMMTHDWGGDREGLLNKAIELLRKT